MVWIIQRIQKTSFTNVSSYFDALYYTIVTFSTVGYGDIVPQTIPAKIISMIIVLSNFLLLLVFLNLFVMKAKRKNDYLDLVMCKISFLFEEMSSCCGVIDEIYKEKYLCWGEWVDIYIELLNAVVEDNPEKVKEIEEKRGAIREYNRKCSTYDETKEFPYYYINSKDQLLIDFFVRSSEEVIKVIDFLDTNRISLLENENLTQEQFYFLKEIKDGFEFASRQYRYGIQEGNNMMQAFKKDLYKDLELLGYHKYNLARFQGYGIAKNPELTLALFRVDISDKKEMFWLRVKEIVKRITKIE